MPGITARDRHRPRADQPLVGAHQGAAAADRADQPGLGPAAIGSLRTRGGRHRGPALQRGGLRGPARVHRAGDPAHLAGERDPADDLARARRGRAVPVRRPARHERAVRAGVQLLEELGALGPRSWRPASADRRRSQARAAADRPAAGPDDPRGRPARLPARGAGHHRRAVDPGPPRAAGRAAGTRRPAARAVPRPALGLPRLAQPLALPARPAAGDGVERLPADVPPGAPQLPAGAGVAGLRVAAAPGGQAGRAQVREAGGRARRGRHPPGAAVGAALAHRPARHRPPRLPRRAQEPGSRSSPVRGCSSRSRTS